MIPDQEEPVGNRPSMSTVSHQVQESGCPVELENLPLTGNSWTTFYPVSVGNDCTIFGAAHSDCDDFANDPVSIFPVKAGAGHDLTCRACDRVRP
jgi:hypothetical protein